MERRRGARGRLSARDPIAERQLIVNPPTLCQNVSRMRISCLLLLLLALAGSAYPATVTLTMDEVGPQGINGLAIAKGGITFTFADAGGTLGYDLPNGGTMTYVQDPTIEGLAEPFSVAFSVPVFSVQFGLAVNLRSAPAGPIASVSLYNGATLVYSGTLAYSRIDPFAEGQFQYSSGVPITSMTVTPLPSAGFQAIGFDNLTVNTASSVPAGTPALSGAGYAALFLGLLAAGAMMARRERLS